MNSSSSSVKPANNYTTDIKNQIDALKTKLLSKNPKNYYYNDIKNLQGYSNKGSNVSNGVYKVKLSKDEVQKLMFNITIIHYLIGLKKIEIDKIKLDIDEDFAILLKIKDTADKVLIIKDTADNAILIKEACPELVFNLPENQLTKIGELIDLQNNIYKNIKDLNNQILNNKKVQNGGNAINNDFIKYLDDVKKATSDFDSAYNIDKDSGDIYQKLENINYRDAPQLLDLTTKIDFTENKKPEIQQLIDTLKDLSDLYYQYHSIFMNLVSILHTLLELNNMTYNEINDKLRNIQNEIKNDKPVIFGGTYTLPNGCQISVPNIEKLREEIDQLKLKDGIILELDRLSQDDINTLKNILQKDTNKIIMLKDGIIDANKTIMKILSDK